MPADFIPADRALESLLAFWAEAGVEDCLEDQPVDRVVAIAPPVRPAPAVVARAPATEAAATPDVAAAIAEARSRAGEASDLAALETAIAGFDGCALKFQGARRAVFSRGTPQAPLMIIGEGPG